METIDTLDPTPFKHLVMTIGNLPSSFTDSMSYYECLAWLVKYLENTVIPAVNQNAEALEELQAAFVTLKNYVDNYFDNLDVQQEINNKLDQMAVDGSLTLLIKNYVDPIYQAYETSINARVADITDDVADLSADIGQINAKVNSATTFAPIPVSSTDDMTDTTKLYLNTTNGKWYYYDGDSWEIGGTYQGTELNTTDEGRLETVESECLRYNVAFPNHGAVNYTGYYLSYEGARCSDYILIGKFTKAFVQLNLVSPWYTVAYYDASKTFISEGSIVGTSSNLYGTITFPEGAYYVRFSNYTAGNANPFAIMFKDDSLAVDMNLLNDNMNKLYEAKGQTTTDSASFDIENSYINPSGAPATFNTCERSDYICVKGYDRIAYKLTLGSANYMIAYYDKNKVFLDEVSIHGVDPVPEEDVTTIPDDAYYVIFSNYHTNNTDPYATLYKNDSLLYTKSILTGKKIGFLGDSITNGYRATVPFRTLIQEATSCDAINYGINSSTLSTYNGNNPVCERYSSMDADLDYVCVLIGTNDTAPMGSADSTDKQTFYGALNVLIEGLITRYTSKRIMFMTLLPRRNNDLSAKNTAIRERCAYYSIPCYDLFINSGMNPNLDIVNTTLFAQSDGLHPNNTGHALLATKIQAALERL